MLIINFRVLIFVLKNPQFSLLDKVIYLIYIVFFVIGVYLLAFSFWNLELNPWGILILLALFPFSKKIYQKFALPFYEATLAPERLTAVKESIEYSQYATKTNLVRIAKINIYTSLLSIAFFFLVFITLYFLGKAGFSSYMLWFVGAIGVVVLFFFFSLLITRPVIKTTSELRANKPRHLRLPFAYEIFIIVLFLGLTIGFIAFRYQALTGRSFLHRFSSLVTSPKNYLPLEYYLVIQLTRFTEDNKLLSKNAYDLAHFTLDQSQKQLKLKYPKQRIEKDLLVDDLNRILILEIIDSEFEREYGNIKYVGLPYTKLPLYFTSIETDVNKKMFSPRIVGIGPDGTITVEREIFDPKVADVEMRFLRRHIGNSYGEDAGTVTEVIKISPGQTFNLTDKTGKRFQLLHLGVFPKSGIISF